MGGQRQWNKNHRKREVQRFNDSMVSVNNQLREFGVFLDELNKRFQAATPEEKAEIRRRLLMDLSQV